MNIVQRAVRLAKYKGVPYTIRRGISIYAPYVYIRFPFLLAPPDDIQMEPTNICNFKCPLCSNSTDTRAKGRLTTEKFKQFYDGYGRPLKLLNLTLDGEPLINPEVFDIASAAKHFGVKHVIIFSNASMIHKFTYEQLLESGVTEFILSFDGATKESYETYRRGGKFEEVLENIKNLCHEKIRRQRKNPSYPYPKLTLQFLVMKHNEHEIQAVQKLAAEYIRPDMMTLKTAALWTNLNKGTREKLAKDWLPTQTEFQRYDSSLEIRDQPKRKYLACPFMFDESVMLWNGDVALCCMDFQGKYTFGNVHEKPFKEIWRSKKFMDIREKVINRKFDFCKECDIPNAANVGKTIRFDNTTIDVDAIKKPVERPVSLPVIN